MKRFLVILGLTALVWLGVSMADNGEYPMEVRVEMVGFDTVRYAVVSADSVLPLKVTMSGFNAFVNSRRQHDIQVSVPQGREAVAVSSLKKQLLRSILGAKEVTSVVDSLHVVLSLRGQRTYKPRIDDVTFSFTEQHGLYGEPTVTPSEVVLYGPDEVLARIDDVKVAAADICNVSASGTYRLPLAPVWEQYPDVKPSCTEVTVYLPVEPYVERDYRVRITVLGADTTVSLRLYPEEATVRAWVPQCDLHRDPEFVVAVNYDDIFLNEGHLTPRLVEFPSYMRPRSVEPEEIQCVVIQ
ncbi:MAG: hypothetical protein IK058_04840 [Bacteroidales bacterium]|nr:hypothetical protein [Bacteroidales bacterium]